jgi:hypothetical protein
VTEFGAFLSYSRYDDENEGQRIQKLAQSLKAEVRSQTGHPFAIFVDRDDIKWGQNWRRRLTEGVEASTFFLPVITPSFFTSDECRNEFLSFLTKERRLERDDLILPIYYIEVDKIEEPAKRDHEEIARAVHAHQYVDWRELRHDKLTSVKVRRMIGQMAERLRDAIIEIPDAIAVVTPPGESAAWKALRGLGQDRRLRKHVDLLEHYLRPDEQLLVVVPAEYVHRMSKCSAILAITSRRLVWVYAHLRSRDVREFGSDQIVAARATREPSAVALLGRTNLAVETSNETARFVNFPRGNADKLAALINTRFGTRR